LLKITEIRVRICRNVTPLKLVELTRLNNKATLKIEISKRKKVHLPPVSNEGNQTNNSVSKKFKGPL